ncbi:MAG TPA: alpha/beta hydrolase [Prolixibacteraceae bacterium]|nr:alpha/beta hydrolase [Prolixibacteraceae bacterium]
MNFLKITRAIMVASLMLLLLVSCHKEEITMGNNASDYFYIERKGASLFTLVRGNTASKIFLLIVHGGPGDSGLSYSNSYMRENIESRYAVIYSDQRDAGSSQGNFNAENLSLDNMAEDINCLISVLKQRYGNDIELFMMAHSFGGLLSPAYLTKSDYQSQIKGLIYADGAFDYPLNDSLTRTRLLAEGERQIAMGKKVDKWNDILSYCHEHTGNFTFEESMKINQLAWKGQSCLDNLKKSESEEIDLNAPEWERPFSAMLSNMYVNKKFSKDILHASYTSQLNKITVPVLIIYGEYDMVCPKELGDVFYNQISSTDKEMFIAKGCTHSPMNQDPDFFYDKAIEFIERLK